jgi:acyl-CoA reductase-like NAD-dependent aldehyde dehydrogenase
VELSGPDRQLENAPALAAGNAMVFKPSEMTPGHGGGTRQDRREAGAPPGLLNVVLGKGDIGAAMANHPGIAKISLTGSVPTGKRVMAAAAGTLKHVTMELGGKSALIVFDDADVDDSVSAAILGNFFTQGEICSNGTRVFVQGGIRDAFLRRLVERTRAIRVGDPLDPAEPRWARSSRRSPGERSSPMSAMASARAQACSPAAAASPRARSPAATSSSRRSSTPATTT